MEISSALINEIKQGRVALFLGAGASFGAVDPNGNPPPLGDDLKEKICQKYFDGRFIDEDLAFVSDMAISETDLYSFQNFVADQFVNLKPSDFHYLISTFKWKGIATTNYDRIVESVYDSGHNPLQKIIPILSNKYSIDKLVKSQNDLPILKLHGCITLTKDKETPLILTIDQFNNHKKGRENLYKIFEEWAISHPIIFVGHRLKDPNLRSILKSVSDDIEVRPRYYLVQKGISGEEQRFWESRKFSVFNDGFEIFLRDLNSKMTGSAKPLTILTNNQHPLNRHLAVREEINDNVVSYLESDVTFINSSMKIDEGNPKSFYKGFDLGWYPISENLDVARSLTEKLLFGVILRAEDDRPSATDFYNIKAEAGAGKSILLKRLAWQSAIEADQLCIFLKEFGSIEYEPIRELHRITKKRIFLFIDGAANYVNEIYSLIQKAKNENIKLTIITTERTNLWNIHCDKLNFYLSDTFTLKYLNQKEIVLLIELLEKYNSLGPILIKKSLEERIRDFSEQAGRQLLVALHEATSGKPFEEILLDEFNKIEPASARNLYLTVCVLNRQGVKVRAGLIARVHNIPFEVFAKEFFAPLEHVVKARENKSTGDYFYTARHSEIAEIVFQQVLRHPADILNEYSRVLEKLNTSYESDKIAFRGMIRAKSLNSILTNYEDVMAVYSAAEKTSINDPYVYQQRANYERIRPNGSYSEACRLLAIAQSLDKNDPSIVHTRAVVLIDHSRKTENVVEKLQCRQEAKKLLYSLIATPNGGSCSRVSLVNLLIDEMKELLEEQNYSQRSLDESIRSIELQLSRSLEQFPDNEYLLMAESVFSRLLQDYERSFKALKDAFNANKRDSFIACRYASALENRSDLIGAQEVLKEALSVNRGNQILNYRYAMLLRKVLPIDFVAILYHLKRGFTKGDKNYDTQFWYSRFAIESNDSSIREEGKSLFKFLRNVPLDHDIRIQIKDFCCNENAFKITFFGSVAKLETMFGYIIKDGSREDVFFHQSGIAEEDWDKLKTGTRVTFNIGYSFSGVRATNIQLC